MVFANITPVEKEAFFLLLDEYFASRGSIAAIAAGKSPGGQAAIKNITSTAGAHLKARTGFGSPFGGSSSSQPSGNTPPPVESLETRSMEDEPAEKPASFAALRGAFVAGGPASSLMLKTGSSASTKKSPPPPPPPSVRYTSRPGVSVGAGSTPENEVEEPPVPALVAPAAPVRRAPSSASNSMTSGLTSRLPPGMVSSAGKHLQTGGSMASSAFGSIRSRVTGSSPAPAVNTSPDSTPPVRGGLPPPPMRRIASTTAVVTPEPEPEPEPEGEWVEALYDYTSDDKTDLHFTEGQRILIIAHTSDDWWTGEVDGREGLFPASYVKPA